MKHLFSRNKRIKVTALVRSFAHLCRCSVTDLPSPFFTLHRHCSNDMHSQNLTMLMKNVAGMKIGIDEIDSSSDDKKRLMLT